MDSRAIVAEYRLAHWAQVMRERRESNLSIKAYCEMVGMNTNQYYYWQRKLREAAYTQMTENIRGTQEARTTPLGFTEVRLAEGTKMALTPTGTTSQGVVYIDVSGIVITAEQSYPTGQLLELLRGLVQIC